RFFLVCAGVFFVFFGVSFVFLLIHSTKEVQLPNLVGKDLITATKELQDRRLRVRLSQKYSMDIPRYQVLAQQPEPGASVKQNRAIEVTVSLGKKVANMPDFHGVQMNEARTQLLELFSAFEKVPSIIESTRTSDKGNGVVLEQSPAAGEVIPLDKDILFVVSKSSGADDFVAENYVMKNFKDVSGKLKSLGMEIQVESRETARSQDIGKIFNQSIAPGEPLRKGDTIRFLIGAEKGFSPDRAKDSEMLRVYSFQVPAFDNTPPEEDTLSTNAGAKKKKKKKTSSKKRKVQIRIFDQLGQENALTRDCEPGEYVDLPYKTVGSGHIEVTVDGELFAKENF
ncbi:MAG: PASTA domain-containing protein, partial [Spirochaetia bacterium]|nr:PASTA domain-containing protein [Spirochaetia bacterium]